METFAIQTHRLIIPSLNQEFHTDSHKTAEQQLAQLIASGQTIPYALIYRVVENTSIIGVYGVPGTLNMPFPVVDVNYPLLQSTLTHTHISKKQ